MKPIQKLFLVFLTASILFSCRKENSEGSIVIPFTLEENRIVINATVNGVEGRYFWDSGSWHTLTTIPLGNLPIVENDRVTRYKRYYIKNGIDINGYTLKTTSIIANITDIANITENLHGLEIINSILKNEGFDGILGYYIFSGYWCELSFTESKIILHKNKPEKFTLSAGGYVDTWGQPLIYVFINETMPFTFVVDTGMPVAFRFPRRFFRDINPAEYREILNVNESYEEVLNEFETQYEIPVHSISLLDDVLIEKYIITSHDNPWDDIGTIGIDYLKHYDLLFDITYNNEPKSNWHIWELYYIPRFPELDKNTLDLSDLRNAKPRIGLTNIFTEQGRFLYRIWKPSIAYSEYGLVPGMTVTHINGVLLNSLTNDEISLLFDKMADDDNCEITVVDLDNQQRTIKRRKQ